MGLLKKVETGLKNVDSKAGQKIDEANIDSDIRKRKSDIEKIKFEIGDAFYKAKKDGKTFDGDSQYDKIVALEKEIEELQAKKEQIIADGKAEREANRRAAE